MKIFTVIIGLFICMLTHAQAVEQEEEINIGEVNQTKTELSDPYCSDGCAEACVEVCCSEGGIFVIGALVIHHEDLMDSREELPMVLSADIMPHFSFSPPNGSFSMMPRVRGSWGVLSTDLKMNYLNEFHDFSAESQMTIHWQMVVSTWIEKQANIRFGTGLLYDHFEAVSYNEHYLAFELYLHDFNYKISLDGRYCANYYDLSDVYSEVNFGFSYKIMESPNSFGYVTFGALYQKIYEKEVAGIQLGLTFNVH
ncbi:MAG: hypothetical protein A2W91_19305 [Bacteroidetes bacterium GWF2_38_335]|nr:MAG: hypothetical protein A2W91_19305 [Bacteroidetes bacterium GWF2_38_335]OFY79907.1 MAG: hypothetical protein A2281_10705 [Bacteroidetes bacterium RIFOXYA12_FULL_38_20]HBS86363.1 hypothetical protein [Bacteroidales bacterium]